MRGQNKIMYRLKSAQIVLKETTLEDIDQLVKWQTIETEWQNWDAPWEKNASFDELNYRERIKKIIELVQKGFKIPYRYEIWLLEPKHRHIGWVSAYYIDDQYHFNVQGNHLAIGIGIPNVSDRNKGYGQLALKTYMHLLKNRGHNSLYIQTWSGNQAMIVTANKLGFKEINRYQQIRTINHLKFDALTFIKEFHDLSDEEVDHDYFR
jgi:RimJ/RimL family protein N-acetyltransferase